MSTSTLPSSFGPTAPTARPAEAGLSPSQKESAMIIVMRNGATAKEIADVVARVEGRGLRVNISRGEERTIIGVIGDDRPVDVVGGVRGEVVLERHGSAPWTAPSSR